MPQPPADLQRRKRQLRLRIGRLRRRIDWRACVAHREGQRLFSWRTAVRRLPGNAMAAAFGVGLALAAGLSARSLARWLGLRLVRHALRSGRQAVAAELRRIWVDSAPRPSDSREDARHE